MERKLWVTAISVLCLALAPETAAQAMAEYALGTAGAAAPAAARRPLPKMNALVGSGRDVRPRSLSAATRLSQQQPARWSAVKKPWGRNTLDAEDPGKITAGLSYEELTKHFGASELEIGADAGVTMLYYGNVIVRLEGGKVGAVRKEPAVQQAGVVSVN